MAPGQVTQANIAQQKSAGECWLPDSSAAETLRLTVAGTAPSILMRREEPRSNLRVPWSSLQNWILSTKN